MELVIHRLPQREIAMQSAGGSDRPDVQLRHLLVYYMEGALVLRTPHGDLDEEAVHFAWGSVYGAFVPQSVLFHDRVCLDSR